MDGTVALFDAASGKLLHTLDGHFKPVRDLCFTPGAFYGLSGKPRAIDGHALPWRGARLQAWRRVRAVVGGSAWHAKHAQHSSSDGAAQQHLRDVCHL